MDGWSLLDRALRPMSPRRHQELEREILDELQFHLEMRAQDNAAAGMTPEEARHEARRQFGDVERIKAQCLYIQEQHPLRTITQFARVVLTLAVGMGAVCLAFLLLNAALLRLPLTYHDDQAWAAVWWENTESGELVAESSLPDFLDWRAGSRSFVWLTLARYRLFNLSGDGPPERVMGKLVSADYFARHGVAPVLGRGFLPEEEEFNAGPVAVLSHDVWQRRYDGSRDVLGRTLWADGEPYTIVGVMPPDFQMYHKTAFFAPLRFDLEKAGRTRRYLVAGRLKNGVSLREAQAELEALVRPAAKRHPEAYARWKMRLRPVREVYAAPVRRNILVFFGFVSVLLLVVCVHVLRKQSSHVLARWHAATLDASRSQARIMAERALENVLLALAGGLVGLWLATVLVSAVLEPVLGSMAHVFDVEVDGRVLGFTLSLSVLLGLAMGVAPLVWGRRAETDEAAGTKDRPVHRGARRFGEVLTVAEVALALVLLLFAGQAIRSVLEARHTAPGFSTERVITLPIDLPTAQFRQGRDQAAFFGKLFERIEALPGVEAASFTQAFPMTDGLWNFAVRVEGRTPASGRYTARVSRVGTDYLALMQFPLLRGRLFAREDGGRDTRVVVVNEALAGQLFPGEDPLGQRLFLADIQTPFEVIGVVGNVRHRGLHREPPPMVYGWYWQWGGPSMTLVVRAASDPRVVAHAVQREIRVLDPNLPIDRATMAEEVVRKSLAGPRRTAAFIALLAVLALGLAMVSMYGLIDEAVRARTREVGIRLAFGARMRDLLTLFLGKGMRVVLAGIAAGMMLTWGGTQLLADVLVEARIIDPLTYVGVGILLIGAVFGAGYLSARRAAEVDPVLALYGA